MTKVPIKKLGSITLGVFGAFVLVYGLLGLLNGTMYVPAKYGSGFTATGLEAYIIAFIPILFGAALSIYIVHNGYIFTNKKAFRVNRLLLTIAMWYTLIYLVGRSMLLLYLHVNT